MRPLALLGALLLAACGQQQPVPKEVGSPMPVQTVAEVASKLAQLDGQRVRVKGWLYACFEEGCSLLADKAALKQLGPVLKAQLAGKEAPKVPSIEIDNRAGLVTGSSMVQKDVVVSGRIQKACLMVGKPKCMALTVLTPDAILPAS